MRSFFRRSSVEACSKVRLREVYLEILDQGVVNGTCKRPTDYAITEQTTTWRNEIGCEGASIPVGGYWLLCEYFAQSAGM